MNALLATLNARNSLRNKADDAAASNFTTPLAYLGNGTQPTEATGDRVASGRRAVVSIDFLARTVHTEGSSADDIVVMEKDSTK